MQVINNPSKFDIIPIHTSDRATFKYCRRQWGWSSPSRANLVPKASVYGIYEPFWYGHGIHWSLERHYASGKKEHPADVFETWFDLQWKGGYISKNDLKQFIDRDPVLQTDGTYRVKGLDEILPMPDVEHFMNLRDIGVGMMKFYEQWAMENDDFEVISTEHDFSVPVFHPGTKKPLYWEDERVMPDDWEPNFYATNVYGSIMREGPNNTIQKQVHLRGRTDMVKYTPHNKQYGIQDYKTAASLSEENFNHLELDEQCTTYLYAGEIEAEMYDLPYKNLSYITYMSLLKGYPRPPTITSRGLPSIDRKNETTTPELFMKAIRSLGLQVVFDKDQKLQAYYNHLVTEGTKKFIDFRNVPRNKIQRENAGIRAYYEAVDMLNKPALYPSPKKEYGCLRCRFRVPCIAAETGGDYKAIIEDGYVGNWDR